MDNIDALPLGNGFAIEPADPVEFARFHAFYREDPFMRDSRAALYALFCPSAPCQWILYEGRRVGGCLAGSGVMGQFFVIPPFDRGYEALRRIALCLRAQTGQRIFAHGVMTKELDHYFRIGFGLTSAIASTLTEAPDYTWDFMRMMVRPVEALAPTVCDATLRTPRKSDLLKIANLLHAAYGTSDPARQDPTSFRDDLTQFFMQNDRTMRAASCLATKEGVLLGACLVVRWEGVPLIFDIAVHPQARQTGIAKAMITHAIDFLHQANESQIRLFLQCGNPAESLYHAMGFLAGPITTSMYLD